VDHQVMAGGQDVAAHRRAHVAKANKAYFHGLSRNAKRGDPCDGAGRHVRLAISAEPSG
jgi:hypothetical protein